MRNKEVNLERFTRREFRKSLESGHFKLAIVATGSVEQHLEHLAMAQDIVSSTYIAERVAERLYPNVLVAVPMSIGIAEHHMHIAGSLSAKPGSWLGVLFDAVESLMRHGIKKILILNGHGGNVLPIEGAIRQWKLYFDNTQGVEQPVDLRFCSYWDLIPKEFAARVLDTGVMPGHAGEFETSFTMDAIPENVRTEDISHNEDPGPSAATREKGALLIKKTLEGAIKLVEEML